MVLLLISKLAASAVTFSVHVVTDRRLGGGPIGLLIHMSYMYRYAAVRLNTTGFATYCAAVYTVQLFDR